MRMRDAGVNLLFLSGNAVCWVTPFRASHDGRPNRIIFRGGPYGGDNDYAHRREKEHGPFPEHGPDEGLLMGASEHRAGQRRRRLGRSQAEHWIFAGTGLKNGDRIPGLVGWEYHGDAAEPPGLEVVAGRNRLGRRPDPPALDRDDLPRSQGKLRLQRVDHLLGPGALVSAGPHAPLVALVAAAWARRSRAEDHGEPAAPGDRPADYGTLSH